MSRKNLNGPLKQQLIQQALQRKLKQPGAKEPLVSALPLASTQVPDKFCQFEQLPGYQQLQFLHRGAEQLGVRSPFFRLHEGTAGATSRGKISASDTNAASGSTEGLCLRPYTRPVARRSAWL